MNEQLKKLQEEVHEWSSRNFPNNKPHHPLLGIAEELGEFSDADDLIQKEDALADALIYSADYAARNGLELMCFEFGDKLPFPFPKLCHYHLKGEQGIRYEAEEVSSMKEFALGHVVGYLDFNARGLGLDLMDSTFRVWNKVKQRDWQKNPINAAKIAEGVA